MRNNIKKGQNGITLIEVVIAAAVLTISSLIAYPTYLSYMDLSRQNIGENIALFDLETALEDLKATSFLEIKTTYPDNSEIVKFNDLHLSDERVTIHYLAATEDPLYIRLDVTWTDFQKNSQTKSIITAITK